MSATAPARAPRMDPRIGQRRAAVTRAQGRRRLRLLVAVLAVVALGIGVLVLLHSPVLAARHVTVTGARHTSRAAVVRAAGLRGAPPLLDVDPGAAATRLEALPWVAVAQVSRHWPDAVVVHVRERVPVAVLSGARLFPSGASVLVDATGRVLGSVPTAPAGLPILVAPVRVGRAGSTLAAPARPGLVVAEAAARALPGRVRGVTVTADGSVRLDLGGGVVATLGPAGGVHAKLAALASVLAGAAPSGPEVIDVSVPGEPTVAPGAPASA